MYTYIYNYIYTYHTSFIMYIYIAYVIDIIDTVDGCDFCCTAKKDSCSTQQKWDSINWTWINHQLVD